MFASWPFKEKVCELLRELVKPFTEMGKMGHEIRGSQPQGVWVDPDPNFWYRFRTLVGVLATGLPLSWFQASTKPAPLHRPQERKLSAEMDRVPTEEASSSCPPKTPLEEACKKLWKNLKTLPETGKRVQQQLKSHLAAVNLPSLRDSEPSEVTQSSGAGSTHVAWDHNVYTDSFVATSLTRPSQPQGPRDRDNSSRRSSRPASWCNVTPRPRVWHKVVVRALSSQVSKPESKGLTEPEEDWLPEEYRPPPPFAPGYC